MRALFARFAAIAGRPGFGIPVTALALILMTLLSDQGAPLTNRTAPSGIVSLELAWSKHNADNIVGSWAHIHQTALQQVELDFPFIVSYALALLFFGVWARNRAQRNGWPRLARAAELAACGGLIAGAFDILEDVGLLLMLNGRSATALALATSLCATIKFALIGLGLVVPSLAAGISQPVQHPGRLTWGSMVWTARAVVGVLLLVALALLLPPQSRDMLAGLSRQNPRGIWSGFAFHVALFSLALGSWYWSRAVLSARFDIADRPGMRSLAAANYGGTPVALNWVPRLLFIAAAGIGMIAAFRSHAHWQLLVIVAWAVPSVIYLQHRLADDGASVGAAALPQGVVFRERQPLASRAPVHPLVARSVLIVAAVLFLIGAVLTFWPGSGWSFWPYWVGWAFPGPAAALLFLALALGPLTALTYWGDAFHPTGGFCGVRWTLNGLPVFLLLLIWIFAWSTFIDLHAVRIIGPELNPVKGRPDLDKLFAAWATECGGNRSAANAKQPVVIRPVIVAVSGGASRAGMWAARVLAAVDAAAADSHTGIFAVSSVSGGSLGAAAYVATLAGQAREPGSGCVLDTANRERFHLAAVDALGEDALGPVLSGALFGDIPRAIFAPVTYLIGDPRGGDRAAALERAFESSWSSAVKRRFAAGAAGATPWNQQQQQAAEFSSPFLSLASPLTSAINDPKTAEPGGIPIWIANGTDAQKGERVLTVPFNYDFWPFAGGTLDAIALLGSDVPVSTAIHNTARFALVSPAGELTPVHRKRGTYPKQLIDGGYFENEGLLTAWELARYLKDNGPGILAAKHDGDAKGYIVDPVLVQASADAEWQFAEDTGKVIRCATPSPPGVTAPLHNEPGQSLGQSRPLQALVPLLGLYSVRGAHSDWVLQVVRNEYCERDKKRFFHFYLYRGDEDVPLNWVLSYRMAKYIWDVLPADGSNSPANPNSKELDALRTALAGQ